MAISEYLGVINAIIFTIAFVLFLVVKLKVNLTKGTIYSYFAFTFIFALTSIYSIFTKMMNPSSAGVKETFYSYFGGFLVNAILGMIIMHGFNIKVFYAFFSIFIASILGVLYILTNNTTSITEIKSDTWFNLSGWDDFLNKTHDIFHYKWEWDDCKNVASQFVWIFKAILTLPIWLLYAVFSGLSALFGLIPTPKPVSPQSWVNETFPIYFQKSVSYTFILLLFIMALIIIVSSQAAMRKQPLNVLAVAFVAAFAYLGYVRFFQYESFTKQFMLTLFVLFMLGIYLYNPDNILKNITGANFTIILFICLFLVGMIFIYNYFTVDAVDMANKWQDIFSKMAYTMIGLSISISIIIWMVTSIAKSQGETPTIGMYILNTLIVIGMLTIVYTSLDVDKLFKDNLYAKLIVNLILYIPCLLSDLADMVMSEYYKMNYFTLIIVLLEIIFIIAYWVIYPDMVSKIYSDEGKVIINNPTTLASKKTVGYYRKLSGSTLLDNKNNQVAEQGTTTADNNYGAFDGDTTMNAVSGKPLLDASGNPMKDEHGNYFMPTRVNTYSYCMSFWLYINPMPSYGDKFMSLLNYGNNPNVMYNPSKNDFSVYMKSPSGDCATTTIIPIYTNMDIPLQKWFNVVLNYDSGRLDVFLNGELVKTSFDVISCIQYDALTIGEDSGANAKICNLTYFRSPVDIVTIRRMYNVAKIQDTPIVPKKDLFSI